MSGNPETLTNAAGVVVFEGTTSESGGSQPGAFVVQYLTTNDDGDIDISGGGSLPEIDGSQTVDGDLVCLSHQAAQSQNGPWIVRDGAPWKRPDEFASGSTVLMGFLVYVYEGVRFNSTYTYLDDIPGLSPPQYEAVIDTDPLGFDYTIEASLLGRTDTSSAVGADQIAAGASIDMQGSYTIVGLPTSDPGILGALYTSGTSVLVSEGP